MYSTKRITTSIRKYGKQVFGDPAQERKRILRIKAASPGSNQSRLEQKKRKFQEKEVIDRSSD